MLSRGPPYRGGVLRAILRPAPLGLLALVLALATGFAFLGQWQLERSSSQESSPALERPRPLSDVLAPAETFTGPVDGQVVTVTGRFRTGDDGAQVIVDGRDQDGRDGSWVVAPLDVQSPAGPGVLAVVRGWLPAGTASDGLGAAGPPPGGETTVTGRLLLGEPARGVSSGPDGRRGVSAVAPADLVNLWGSPVYTGFVIASSPAPDPPLQPVASEAPTRGTDFRSLSYGLQWFLFAGLALLAWWRVVKERFLPEELAEQHDPLSELEARRAGDPHPSRGAAPDRRHRDADHHPQHVEAP